MSLGRLGRRLKISLMIGSIMAAAMVAPPLISNDGAWAARAIGKSRIGGRDSGPREQISAETVLKIQKALRSNGLYPGRLDGQASRLLRASIRMYQRRTGRKLDGLITEELADHLQTQGQVGVMLRLLQENKAENIQAARKLLLGGEATRGLLTDPNIDEVADPTRDASPCFRDPGERCLLEEAVESAKAIFKPELRDWAFGEILVAQAKVGLIGPAIETVRRIGDARLIIVALKNIALAQARAGRIEAAQAAAAIIPEPFKRMEALAAIAEIQLKNDDGDGAHETAARVLSMAEKLTDSLARVTLLARMAVVLNRVGAVDAAAAALAEARRLTQSAEMARRLTKTEQGAALRHVASALAEVGQPSRALAIIDKVSGAYDRTAVRMSVAAAEAAAGNAEGAIAIAETIENKRYQAVVLGRIAVVQARAGKLTEAADTIAIALESSSAIELPYARSYAISRVAMSLIEMAEITGDEYLGQAVKTARRIENDRLRAYALWSAAAAQKKNGNDGPAKTTEDLARAATKEIKSALSRVWMFGDIAREHAVDGDSREAAAAFRRGIVIAENIHNSWGRARALAKLAATLYDLR